MRELRRQYSVVAGQWLLFTDDYGSGYAQPDLWIEKDRVYLLEAKLRATMEGEDQLVYLYAPLLRFMLRKPVVMILAFKYPRPEMDESRFIDRLEDASLAGINYWQWRLG